MSFLGLILVVAAVVGGIALVGRKRSQGRMVPMVLIGVVAAVVVVATHRTRDTREVNARYLRQIAAAHFIGHDPIDEVEVPEVEVPKIQVPKIRVPKVHVPEIRVPEINVPEINIDFDRGFPFRAGDEPQVVRVERHFRGTWFFISAGILALIVGSFLVRRHRTQPRTIKAISVLGIGAIIYAVVSFFDDVPRAIESHDRVVKSNAQPRAPRERTQTEKSKRIVARAKRPSSRPHRGAQEPAQEEALPPRAGEIPVSAELAATRDEGAPTSAAATNDATPAPPAVAESPAASIAPSAAAPATPASEQAPASPVESAESPDAVAATPAPPSEPAPNPEPTAPASTVAAPASPDASATQSATPSVAATEIKSAETGAADMPTAQPDRATDGRPDWVDAPPRLEGSIYSMAVGSGLFVSVPECQRELDAHIKREADHYIDEYLGEGASRLVDIPLPYLKEHIKKAEFSEVIVKSVGPMHQLHALLAIDDQARTDFQRRWHEAVVTDRLWYTGSGTALLLALLATFYGYLKLDLRTGGSQKARLQLAATLVALLVAAGAFLVRWAVPF
jgi:hypothetical protein